MATLAGTPTPLRSPEIWSGAIHPIVLENLTHSYGDRIALNGLSFDVRPGEIFGLLGPNGSGKTTLFRILSTLMTPTGGTARIRGFDVASDPNKVRQQIGIVFQARSLDLKLTVQENLKHQGHLYGLSGTTLKERISEVLDRVGLLDRAGDFTETLSGGMQRRVELAKGLIHSPAVLLLDEPTTGLDPGARRDLWQYLAILGHQEGVSILVTTHLMEEAEHCDRLAILHEGKLAALGTPSLLKSEIGGDVIRFETSSPVAAETLAIRLQQRFQTSAQVMADSVRLEHPHGHRFVASVVEAFPGMVQAVSVAKPSLEDVFIQRTGHRFWIEPSQPEEPSRTRKRS